MKRYWLLRNNVESGPRTLAELQSEKLRPHDLVKPEGNGTRWENPADIEELKNLIQSENDSKNIAPTEKHPLLQNAPKAVFITLPDTAEEQSQNAAKKPTDFWIGLKRRPNFGQISETIKETKSVQFKHKRFFPPDNAGKIILLWLLALISGGASGILLFKLTYPAGKKTAAFSKLTSVDSSAYYRNVLARQRAADSLKKAFKPIAFKTLKKMVRVKANDYKVGLLGGVDELELNVYNGSTVTLDKVSIEINYLRPNGDTVNTQTVMAKNIAPKRSKTVTVPPSKRGVKVVYRITAIQQRRPKPTPLQV